LTGAILAFGLGLALASPGLAQPAPTPDAPQVTTPRAATQVSPKPRLPEVRNRSQLEGAISLTPGFSGGLQGSLAAPIPRAELAPRPNREIELRSAPPSFAATVSPTVIYPSLPSRGAATEGAAAQSERRFLQTPAPGARLNVPLIW